MNSNSEQQLSDPRISSPVIKVVYPSLRGTQSHAQPEVIVPRTPQNPPIIAESQPVQVENSNISTSGQVVTGGTGTANPKTTETTPAQEPVKQKWVDLIKKHTALILVVALAGFAIGFLIGKNK